MGLAGPTCKGHRSSCPGCAQCLPQPIDPPAAAYTHGVVDGTDGEYGETLDGHDSASRAWVQGGGVAAERAQDSLRRLQCAQNI